MPDHELTVVKVRSLVRAPLRLRLRYWWMRRQMKKRLTPAGLELVDRAERDWEREVIFGTPHGGTNAHSD